MIGIDEVGRGCWAGPLLVVAARMLSTLPNAVTDSKKLSKSKRAFLLPYIVSACEFGEGWVEADEIDALGLTRAMRLGVARALKQIHAEYGEKIILDGMYNYCSVEYTNVQCVIRADSLHPIVSAASIYAKELRDKKMVEYGLRYPAYGFERHVGYGTKAHSAVLEKRGVTPLHRLSYKPLRKYV